MIGFDPKGDIGPYDDGTPPEFRMDIISLVLKTVGENPGPVTLPALFQAVLAFADCDEEIFAGHMHTSVFMLCMTGLIISNTPNRLSVDTVLSASKGLTSYSWGDATRHFDMVPGPAPTAIA